MIHPGRTARWRWRGMPPPALAPAMAGQGWDIALTGITRIEAFHVGRVGGQRLAGALAPLAAQPLYVEPPEARPQPALRPAPV